MIYALLNVIWILLLKSCTMLFSSILIGHKYLNLTTFLHRCVLFITNRSSTLTLSNKNNNVAFLATMGIEPMTLCLQGGHANHLIKIRTMSQVASGSPYEVTGGYDSSREVYWWGVTMNYLLGQNGKNYLEGHKCNISSKYGQRMVVCHLSMPLGVA